MLQTEFNTEEIRNKRLKLEGEGLGAKTYEGSGWLYLCQGSQKTSLVPRSCCVPHLCGNSKLGKTQTALHLSYCLIFSKKGNKLLSEVGTIACFG